MESIVLLPVVLTYSTVLASSLVDDTMLNTQNSLSLILKSKDTDHTVAVKENMSEISFEDICSSMVDTNVHVEVPLDSCADGVYLFKEWTSSTGLLFSVLLLYIGLVTITNIVVVYKFIATWNQITVSLREQNRVCSKYSSLPSTRRQTCQEALKTSRYNCEDCYTSVICPICLLDLQSQEFVVSCDGGCGTKFHKNCIYNWLEFKGTNENVMSDSNRSCPCCRKEMIGIVATDPCTTTSGNGFISELSTLVGYYPY
jgi:Ring finger domain